MSLLSFIARWLEWEDPLVEADAILVLDGGEDENGNRIRRGLDLLRRGIAPWLLVSHSTFGTITSHTTEGLTQDERRRIYWLPNNAASTRQEARMVLQVLKRLEMTSLLVVTSTYHTRRTRLIFTRELFREGIQVNVFPATVPGYDPDHWWKTRYGRSLVLFEALKTLCARVHFDVPLSTVLRARLKIWVERTVP